jgi:hypothetical protein
LYLISSKEIKRACEKKMPYDFTYFILICKLYKSEKTQTKKKKKKKQQQSSGGSDEPEILWSNPEEELIDQVCESYEFSLKISDFLFLICMCQRTVTLTGHYTVPVPL